MRIGNAGRYMSVINKTSDRNRASCKKISLDRERQNSFIYFSSYLPSGKILGIECFHFRHQLRVPILSEVSITRKWAILAETMYFSDPLLHRMLNGLNNLFRMIS